MTHDLINEFANVIASDRNIRSQLDSAPDEKTFARLYARFAQRYGFSITMSDVEKVMEEMREQCYEHMGEDSISGIMQ